MSLTTPSQSLSHNKVLQKLTKSYKSELRNLFQCCILIPMKCPRKTPFQHTVPPPSVPTDLNWGSRQMVHCIGLVAPAIHHHLVLTSLFIIWSGGFHLSFQQVLKNGFFTNHGTFGGKRIIKGQIRGLLGSTITRCMAGQISLVPKLRHSR